MKSAVLVVALVACQSKSPSPAPATGSAPAAPPAVVHTAEVCQAALGVLDRASCPNNDAGLRTAKTSLTGIINTMTKVGDADPSTYDIMCARLLLALEADVRGSGSASCTLPIDAELRTKIQRTLDAYYNQHTDVTKTGDAASDDAIAKLAAIRDAACECRTSACIDQLDAKMTNMPTLPATAPQAAKDLAGKVLDDASRCAQRARMNP
ncbi:MAG: hypothetical protein JO257_24305 [Deltaproteobacteria bacterium]|nr:hypothetical protein [Deltaproteobacteria bacterium]